MTKRIKIPQAYSKKLFNKTAGARHVHGKNTRPMPMRGGIRM